MSGRRKKALKKAFVQYYKFVQESPDEIPGSGAAKIFNRTVRRYMLQGLNPQQAVTAILNRSGHPGEWTLNERGAPVVMERYEDESLKSNRQLRRGMPKSEYKRLIRDRLYMRFGREKLPSVQGQGLQ